MSQAESARRFYDRVSGVYDALADASEHEARSRGLQLLDPSGDERVLEIGVGTGHALVEIARRLSPLGRLAGIDVSARMLEIAARRIEREGRARTAWLQLADAAELPYAGSTFDVVFMSFTLELFDEGQIRSVLAETARVLAPAGRLGVVSLLDDGHKTAIVDLYRFLHRHFPHIVDCRPIDVASHLERAGFTPLDHEKLSIWGLPVAVVVARTAEAR